MTCKQPKRLRKIFCFSNHKGGVAKTCSVSNVGAGLSKLGKQCLLVDLDPQCNLSMSLGVHESKHSIYDVLKGKASIKRAICNVKEGLDVLPADIDLAGIEIEMGRHTGRELLLKGYLNEVKDRYDYILLDCPPSLGFLTINALVASQDVFIPLQAQYLALQGLSRLVEVIDKVKTNLNGDLEIGGVLITQYDKRKILNRDVAEAIEKHFGEKVFKTRIRNNISLAEAPSLGVDIFQYNPRSYGAKDYLELCNEITNVTL